jgi:VIT1/CCC1 family predicted Fe2+/Mn2+ transporter
VLNLGYRLFWFLAGIRIGYPSLLDIFLTPLSLWAMGLFNWVTFAIFGELIGRKLGGRAPRRVYWGALAVANAPQLLTLFNIIPGLVVPSGLLWSWTLLTSYQATQATYPQLNWRRTLITTLAMYALHYFFIFLSIVLGVLLGVLIYSLAL